MNQPRTWPHTTGTLRARAVLAHAAADQTLDLQARLAALDALGELEDDLPAGYAPAPVEPAPGRLTDAHQLLGEQGHDAPVRDRIAAARAAARLQPWTGPRS